MEYSKQTNVLCKALGFSVSAACCFRALYMQDGQSTFNQVSLVGRPVSVAEMYHTFLLLDPARQKIETSGWNPFRSSGSPKSKKNYGIDLLYARSNRRQCCQVGAILSVCAAIILLIIYLGGSSPAAVATITSTTSTPYVAPFGGGVDDASESSGSGQTPVEYEGFISETYEKYYGTPGLGKAMQACGVINDDRYLKNGQCAVFFDVDDENKSKFCTPFYTQSSEEPTCTKDSLLRGADDAPIVLFRSNGLIFNIAAGAFFAATATKIQPDGATAIEVITADQVAANPDATITSASMPFEYGDKTYAVVATNLGPFGAQIYNLNSGDSAFLYHGSARNYKAHAAAVGNFGTGDWTIALLYHSEVDTSGTDAPGQYLGFYDDLAVACSGDNLITACDHMAKFSVKVFPDSVAPKANNADLVFDSTHSYVLVTLGNMFVLVSVPTTKTPAKVLTTTSNAYDSDELGVKAAFGPAPPTGDARQQLFVLAFGSGIAFGNVNDQVTLPMDKQVIFTPDPPTPDPAFTTEKILGVEWSSPEEVIVYRENSLQKVTVPGAVLRAYRGYNSLTYPQYYTGTDDFDAWPMSAGTPAPAMQACGMINRRQHRLKNGQCAVFSDLNYKFCTPFFDSSLVNGYTATTTTTTEQPVCFGNSFASNAVAAGKSPILFRLDDDMTSFAATATHIYPYDGDAITWRFTTIWIGTTLEQRPKKNR